MKRSEAIQLRALVEKAVLSLDDKDASKAACLFPRLRCDKEQTADTPAIPAGSRINWGGKLKTNKVTLWDTEANNPDNLPDMWADIAYRDGHRIAPDVFTPENAAALDECMWFGDELYRSKAAGNVYTPVQAPGSWEKVQA